jgi:hypothetical protein
MAAQLGVQQPSVEEQRAAIKELESTAMQLTDTYCLVSSRCGFSRQRTSIVRRSAR